MADGKAAGIEFGEQWLHIAQNGLAGRRIAHMPDRGVARQPIDHLASGEGITDKPMGFVLRSSQCTVLLTPGNSLC